MELQLKQTLPQQVNGNWDGGPKRVFYWSIDREDTDCKGTFVRVGSWEANHYFHVAKGKTVKQTLSYAKAHLKASTRIKGSTFEYVLAN